MTAHPTLETMSLQVLARINAADFAATAARDPVTDARMTALRGGVRINL